MSIVSYLVTALAAYLLGSIPSGFLGGKARGIDIRAVGSGNIGATNVLRTLGKPAAMVVFLADALKGWVAVKFAAAWIVNALLPSSTMGEHENAAIIAAVCAILGHNYTCWLGFKGGKGIATSAGVLTALVPWALLIIFSIWIVLSVVTRIVSVASIAAAAALPFASWFTTHNWTLTLVTGALGALAIYKHKANIQRLIAGTEPRVDVKPRVTGAAGEAVK